MKTYKCLKENGYSYSCYSLVPVRAQDILLIREWRNQQIDCLRQKVVLSVEDQQLYFNEIIWPSFNEIQPKQILFSILKDNHCIGYGGLVHIGWEDRRAEVSFLLNTEGVKDKELYRNDFSCYLHLIKTVVFDDLQFNRIHVETFDIRGFHISILEESGFKMEGRLKQHVLIDGHFIDSLIHGYLREYYYA